MISETKCQITYKCVSGLLKFPEKVVNACDTWNCVLISHALSVVNLNSEKVSHLHYCMELFLETCNFPSQNIQFNKLWKSQASNKSDIPSPSSKLNI